jgi:hypothetical protein
MAQVAKGAVETGIAPDARLLYTAQELRETRKLQALAQTEQSAGGGGR